MWRSRFDKAILFSMILLFSGLNGWSQQVLAGVQMQKVSATHYKVKYQLNQAARPEFDSLTLKIFRRRQGTVEEVFSAPLTIPASKTRYHSYDWNTDTATVKPGDELQAKIILSYNKPAVVRSGRPPAGNVPPKANAGTFQEVQLPLTSPITLNGSASVDSDGRIVSIRWSQVGGPTLVEVNSPNAAVSTISGDLREGRYAFQLTIKDDKGATSTDRVIVTVKGAATGPPVTQRTEPVVPKSGDSIRTSQADPLQVRTRLKGGPSNALINVLVPGLGHYFVSGDHRGKGRNISAFGITLLYAGAAGGAYYFKMRGDDKYQEYLDAWKYREYQRDANGDVIGVRGTSGDNSDLLLKQANDERQKALILGGVAAGILTADLVLTYAKGMKNKRAWENERRGTTKLFISSDGISLTAGIRIKL